jgi:hypothetical protein
MHLKDAGRLEYKALRTKYNHLLIITADKNCDLFGISAKPVPSLEEQKVIAQKVK